MPKAIKKHESATPAVVQSVEQIWLAGLGALAVAEDEGSKAFRSLVKRGEGLEREGRARIRKARARAVDLRETTMQRVESGLDNGMSAVLGRLGVPTKRDIAALTRRVEALTTALQKRQPPGARKRTTRRTRATVG